MQTKVDKIQALIDSVERELALTVPGSFEAEILQDQLISLESAKASILTANIIDLLLKV